MRLALKFNRLDVNEMLEEMPSSIFYKWYHHYLSEPWGYELELHNHAELCSYVVNGLFKLKTPVKPSEFYPTDIFESIENVDKTQSWSDMKAILKGISDG